LKKGGEKRGGGVAFRDVLNGGVHEGGASKGLCSEDEDVWRQTREARGRALEEEVAG